MSFAVFFILNIIVNIIDLLDYLKWPLLLGMEFTSVVDFAARN